MCQYNLRRLESAQCHDQATSEKFTVPRAVCAGNEKSQEHFPRKHATSCYPALTTCCMFTADERMVIGCVASSASALVASLQVQRRPVTSTANTGGPMLMIQAAYQCTFYRLCCTTSSRAGACAVRIYKRCCRGSECMAPTIVWVSFCVYTISI